MTTREFQVVHRRANLLDIITPKRPGVQGYRFRAAANFDGTFVTILTADISSGFLDPTVDRRLLTPFPAGRNHIRIVFDPQGFFGVAGIEDAAHFWLTFTPVDFAGAPGTESAPGLILPADQYGAESRITIQGNAPNGASLADSLQLDLPLRMQDFRITNNDGANSLFISASDTGGGEQEVRPTLVHKWSQGAVGTLHVRGGGAVVNFSASFTNYLPL